MSYEYLAKLKKIDEEKLVKGSTNILVLGPFSSHYLSFYGPTQRNKAKQKSFSELDTFCFPWHLVQGFIFGFEVIFMS